MLETIEIETAPQPSAAIIWLHGLGADGHDFESIVPEIVGPGERAWRFIFPNAPIRPVTVNGGSRMRAWYDISALGHGSAEDVAGFRDSASQVQELIAREGGRGVVPERIVVAGFSQGGAVSLYAVPRFDQRLAGVMVLSAYLPLESVFKGERCTVNDATPIFMAHGRADSVIPMSLGSQSRDFLKLLGYRVEWHEYPMAHSVCQAEVADIRKFLFRVLP